MGEGVKVHSLVVIPEGEMAWGTIVDAKPNAASAAPVNSMCASTSRSRGHGKDVVIAKGAPVTAYVDQNTALDRRMRNSLLPMDSVMNLCAAKGSTSK